MNRFRPRSQSFLLIALPILWLFSDVVSAQSRETLIKAGFIEKFTHFVQWTDRAAENSGNKKFVIAVIGQNNISSALQDIFKKSGSKDIKYEIREINSIAEIKDCRILFISGSERNTLKKIIEYTSGKPILTISDSNGFGEQGVIINMFQDGNYIRYQVNRKSLEESGLVINSLLLNYAVII